ncbi:tetratricopeptide repeat protein [archaeon]|nr:MAG: tetratricopeptide repeat protein [archaeon]
MKILPLFISFLLSLVLLFVASAIEAENLDVDSGLTEDISFNSERELREHMKKMNQEKASVKKSKTLKQHADENDYVLLDEEELPSESQLKELRRQEIKQRLDMRDVEEKFGRISMEYATSLHTLGRVLYKQFNFKEMFQVAKAIVEIHEKLDGVESLKTAQALSNLGSAAYRVKNKKETDFAMNRALYILIKVYGNESKEVLLHRGRMLTFQIPYAETSSGLSYDDYEYEL